MQPRLERLAAGWPELDFYKLTYEEADGANRKLFRSLGITKLPYMTIAVGGETIDGFLCPPKKLPMLRQMKRRVESADGSRGKKSGEWSY